MFKKDQEVKAGRSLVRQSHCTANARPLSSKEARKYSARPVTTQGESMMSQQEAATFTHLVHYERLIIPDLHV